MEKDGRSIFGTLARGARLRCPACGGPSVFQSPFRVRAGCPGCGTVFQREEGFFVGAIMLNVVTTEGAVMTAAGLSLLLFPGHDRLLVWLVFAAALLFPVAFYHHSWSLWLAGDHLVEGLPRPPTGA
ncbi:MAG TPA: zinc ribbon domain-containing protein [Pyrinomonadaceae bacterium]